MQVQKQDKDTLGAASKQFQKLVLNLTALERGMDVARDCMNHCAVMGNVKVAGCTQMDNKKLAMFLAELGVVISREELQEIINGSMVTQANQTVKEVLDTIQSMFNTGANLVSLIYYIP